MGGSGGAVDFSSEDSSWIISVDDHVIEPPGVWQDRLPAKYLDAAPRLVRDDLGEAWVIEGKRKPIEGLAAVAGRDKEEFGPTPLSYAEMRPGCYDSAARLADMNADRVLASLCFPSFPRFCGQVFYEAADKELGHLCVQAYNDWMIDEWCGAAPGRFIPMTLIPLWDPPAAAREIERCAAKGGKAIAFSENPVPLGLPSLYDPGRYWDPVFAAAAETGTVVCTHIGSSSQLPRTGPETPLIAQVVLAPLNAMNNLVDWIFSGMLLRHPGLKLCLSEGGIGWIPAVLERLDRSIKIHRYWAARGDDGFRDEARGVSVSREVLDADPIQTFHDHVYGCFIDDIFGAANIDAVGVDNVMAESDYPHSDSSWPNTLPMLKERLKGRSDEDFYKIVQGNARRVFNFKPAPPPTSPGSAARAAAAT